MIFTVSNCDRPEALNEALRHMREAADITQGELAERLATSQPAVSNWERPGGPVSIGRLLRVANACGFRPVLTLEREENDDAGDSE